mmetsp:Transcript_3223/g.9259  ORF Transcript_3223/g.9259 Transcript_3223/m.9259 type:complete len:299 (+) Transcript_3223:1074-1970(+)
MELDVLQILSLHTGAVGNGGGRTQCIEAGWVGAVLVYSRKSARCEESSSGGKDDGMLPSLAIKDVRTDANLVSCAVVCRHGKVRNDRIAHDGNEGMVDGCLRNVLCNGSSGGISPVQDAGCGVTGLETVRERPVRVAIEGNVGEGAATRTVGDAVVEEELLDAVGALGSDLPDSLVDTKAGARPVNVICQELGGIARRWVVIAIDDAALRPVAVAVGGSRSSEQKRYGYAVRLGGNERRCASRNARSNNEERIVRSCAVRSLVPSGSGPAVDTANAIRGKCRQFLLQALSQWSVVVLL